MAGLAHSPQVCFVVTLRGLAKMRCCKHDIHVNLAASIFEPSVIDFPAAAAMLEALTATFALLMTIGVSCSLTNFDYYASPIWWVSARLEPAPWPTPLFSHLFSGPDCSPCL